MAKLQFSITALLLTVSAIAGVLALMFQVPAEAARITFVGLVPLASVVVITGIMHGSPKLRTFCTGALVPLGMMLVLVTINLPEIMLSTNYVMNGGRPGSFFLLSKIPTCLGSGFLASIALGYFCIVFRWLVERPRS